MLIGPHSFSSKFLSEIDTADASPPTSLQAGPHELGVFGSSSVDPPPASAWWYDPARHGNLEAFATSPDFRHFATQFDDHLWVLLTELAGRPGARQLMMFGERVTTVDPAGTNPAYGATAHLLYRGGAEALARIVQHVRQGQLPRETCATALEELATQLDDCAPGALSALVTTESRLGSGRLHLGGSFRTFTGRVVEQVAIEVIDQHYAQELQNAPGSHRHLVAGLQPVLLRKMGVAWRTAPDEFAPDASRFPPSLITDALNRLLGQCHPDAVVRLMAEQYLSRFQEAMRQEDTPGPGTPKGLGERVQRCTATLMAEFGDPPPLEALLQECANTGVYGPRSDTAGIERHFVDRLGEAGLIRGGPVSWSRIRARHAAVRPLDLRLMTAGSAP